MIRTAVLRSMDAGRMDEDRPAPEEKTADPVAGTQGLKRSAKMYRRLLVDDLNRRGSRLSFPGTPLARENQNRRRGLQVAVSH